MGIHQIVVNVKGESGKMPKICVNSPEISMEGDISLHAQVSIVTKAKLDEVKVAGNCACDGPPPPRPKTPEEEHNVEVIVKVDGKEVARDHDRTRTYGQAKKEADEVIRQTRKSLSHQ